MKSALQDPSKELLKILLVANYIYWIYNIDVIRFRK
jgi:hypothetical protein